MRRADRWLIVPLLVFVGACGETDAPFAPDALEIASQQSDAAACFAVEFNVSGPRVVLGPGIIELRVTGDLQGVARYTFDLNSPRFAGVTAQNRGTTLWMLTGGPVQGLETFTTQFVNRGIWHDRPGSPADVFENTGRHWAVDGVRVANLHYTGTSGGVAPNWDHRGVICP